MTGLREAIEAWIRHGEAVPADVTTYDRGLVHEDLRNLLAAHEAPSEPDLTDRLRRAVERLEEMRDSTWDPRERARLDGKIEGVKLAASYLEEGSRIFSTATHDAQVRADERRRCVEVVAEERANHLIGSKRAPAAGVLLRVEERLSGLAGGEVGHG